MSDVTAVMVTLREAVKAYERATHYPNDPDALSDREAWLTAFTMVSESHDNMKANRTICKMVEDIARAREAALTEVDVLCAVRQVYNPDYKTLQAVRYQLLEERAGTTAKLYAEILALLGLTPVDAHRDLQERHKRTCQNCREKQR
jgi:hypothetical protein